MFGWLCRATYCSVVSTLMLGVLHAIQNKKKLLNELDKKRPGTSQMSERFGPNFVPGSFALQQSIRLVYMLRALSRGRNRATRATRDNQDVHTPTDHTRSATETQHNSQPETPNGSWPLLLPRRRQRHPLLLLLLPLPCCCCCCAAAASRSAMHRGAQPVTADSFVVWCFF